MKVHVTREQRKHGNGRIQGRARAASQGEVLAVVSRDDGAGGLRAVARRWPRPGGLTAGTGRRLVVAAGGGRLEGRGGAGEAASPQAQAAKVKTVPGHYASPVALPRLIRPSQLGRPGRARAWPAAGSGTVTLTSGARTRSRAGAGRWVAVAGLPVQVASVSGSPVRSVRVGVASHGQTVAAGSDGMLLELTRADGAVLAGKVKVRVNYARIAGEFGAGYGARLALFEMPACALTTPGRAACRGMAPVGSPATRRPGDHRHR